MKIVVPMTGSHNYRVLTQTFKVHNRTLFLILKESFLGLA